MKDYQFYWILSTLYLILAQITDGGLTELAVSGLAVLVTGKVVYSIIKEK